MARPLTRHIRLPSLSRKPLPVRIPISQLRSASTVEQDPEVTDPNMNGGYVNPPPMKRALRDPYADWWDKQERRNFGEPVHEDNDLLTVFSTEPYTHASPAKAGLHFMAFVGVTLGLIGTVYTFTPNRPATFRTFDGGLESELGGSDTKQARKMDTDPAW